ncbi:MAG: uracil-DNA glycosylase [Patescibacteria group bacterium]
MDENGTIDAMKAIKDEILALTESPLFECRVSAMNFPVIGEGNHSAKLMFVGEAPGKNEARTGRPFCGASGKVLDRLLAHIGLERAKVYVTNVVKDRPPENRDPTPDEIEIYGPFLLRQIEIIKPRVIATLGRFSMKYLMENYGIWEDLPTISKIHGRRFEISAAHGTVDIVPLYHPAVAIYNQHEYPTLAKDFEILREIIEPICKEYFLPQSSFLSSSEQVA